MRTNHEFTTTTSSSTPVSSPASSPSATTAAAAATALVSQTRLSVVRASRRRWTSQTSYSFGRLLATLVFLATGLLSHLTTTLRADVVIISPSNKTTQIFENAELAFGPVPNEGVTGKIVLSEPEDACTDPIKEAPSRQHSWFLLATSQWAGGDPCTLETKTRNAAKAGFKAVIVYSSSTIVDNNNKKRSSYYTGQKAVKYNPPVYIPTIFISYMDGLSIKKEFLYDKGYTAVILPRVQLPLNAYLLPFAIVIFLCASIMVSFLCCQIITCARDRRKTQRRRLTHKQLRQLLTIIYTKGSHYYDTCAICLDDYVEGEKLRVLTCAHGYHLRCIDPWLTKSRRCCPVCKGKVRVAGMSDFSDTESEDGRHHSTSRPVSSYGNNTNNDESTSLLGRQMMRPPTSSRPPPQESGTITTTSNNRAAITIGSINGSIGSSRPSPLSH